MISSFLPGVFLSLWKNRWSDNRFPEFVKLWLPTHKNIFAVQIYLFTNFVVPSRNSVDRCLYITIKEAQLDESEINPMKPYT